VGTFTRQRWEQLERAVRSGLAQVTQTGGPALPPNVGRQGRHRKECVESEWLKAVICRKIQAKSWFAHFIPFQYT